jgi:hypothetical protein
LARPDAATFAGFDDTATLTVTATDGVTNVSKSVAATSHIEAARTALGDAATFAGFDDSATLTVTVTP